VLTILMILIGSKFEMPRCLGEINRNTATFKERTSTIVQSSQSCIRRRRSASYH
jgi:hypothetical protein